MKKKPKILITNDDGIQAPGIRHLFNALSSLGDLTIMAPAAEQSAAGMSITIRQPLRIERIEWPNDTPAWSASGTPADCVKLALSVILKEVPDLVVSGINRGTNAGRNIFYSGTVAGVIEGVLHDIPGVAFSCCEYHNPQYDAVEKHVLNVIQYVLENPLPQGTFLNVNFPLHQGKINGYKMARHGKEYWGENPDKRQHPAEGHSYYWLGAKLAQFEEEEDSDIYWLQKGYMTAVPVHIGELTDLKHLKARREHFENLF